jgi:rhamnopyranosyl-N-acetylglucosaminyl-diphospho-decaprenol beta-1,3/1,4-galactofuranosyltransferase
MNITAIIVTYNRKVDLLRCIWAVLSQTHKVTSIVIIDNASTDNTFEYIYQDLYNCSETQVPELNKNTPEKWPPIAATNVYYEYEKKNTGGAGGFCRGMEIADQILQSDYIWMMDDDGYPNLACLEHLIIGKKNYAYCMPISLDITDNTKLSWPIRKKNWIRTIYYKDLYESWGPIMDRVVPFNGVLLSKSCIKEVGYINKDFFIWGDDYEHYWRCKKHGITPVTLMNAIFYHPANKISLVPILGGLFKLPYVSSKLRMVCLARNSTYINLHYSKKTNIVIKFFMYSWLFLITRKLDIEGYKLYLASVADAFKKDFTRHLKYL